MLGTVRHQKVCYSKARRESQCQLLEGVKLEAEV